MRDNKILYPLYIVKFMSYIKSCFLPAVISGTLIFFPACGPVDNMQVPGGDTDRVKKLEARIKQEEAALEEAQEKEKLAAQGLKDAEAKVKTAEDTAKVAKVKSEDQVK